MILQMIVGLVLITAGVVGCRFFRWKKSIIARLHQGSDVIETTKGPIEYKIHGTSGDYVLFLHGSPGGYDQYAIHRGDYFQRFRVIAISRFGFLRTPLSTAMTLSDQADALAAFLDALNIDRIIVSAGSGGGPLALAFAAYHPQRVSHLVLYAVASQAMELDDNRPGIRVLKSITRSDFLSWLLLLPLTGKPKKLVAMLVKDETNRAKIIDSGLADRFGHAMAVVLPPSLRVPGMDNDVRNLRVLDLPKHQIRAATLIIHGNRDGHVPYEHSKLLSQQIPHARLVTVEGGDHFAAYTHEGMIEQAYRDFFSETATQQAAVSASTA